MLKNFLSVVGIAMLLYILHVEFALARLFAVWPFG